MENIHWTGPDPARVLLIAPATGGGHRAAAAAVGEALRRFRLEPVWCDPLTGTAARPLLRWAAGRYGPLVRRAPWAWGALYYLTDNRPVAAAVRAMLRRTAAAPITAALTEHRLAAIVSFHPLTTAAAVTARDLAAPDTPVVTVVTDLARPHRLWLDTGAHNVVLPAPAEAHLRRRAAPVPPTFRSGVPVAAAFTAGPAGQRERAALRRWLGLDPELFWVLVCGGGEGAGGLVRRVRAILRRLDGVGVIALCGHNRRAVRRLSGRYDRRLHVLGFVDNVADWLRCADVLVGKAGPGMIAEASCCGVPLLLTGHLPGQERGNTELVTEAGAGVAVRSVRGLLRELDDLRRDAQRLAVLRAGTARLVDPAAATRIAALVAELAGADQRAETAHARGTGS